MRRDASVSSSVSPMRLRPLLLCSSLAFAGGLASVVERAPTAGGIDRIGAVVDRIRTTQRFAAGVADRCAPLVDALDADLKNLRGVYKREEKREKALRRAAKRIAELESERAPEERTTDLG